MSSSKPKKSRIEARSWNLDQEGLPPDIFSLPLNKRMESIRRFWESKRELPLWFQLRGIKDLSSNADTAMNILFKNTCATIVERVPKNDQVLYRCGYKWSASQPDWVYGFTDKLESVAKLSAAIAGLKTILGPKEYATLDKVSESLNFRGMTPDQVQHALLMEHSEIKSSDQVNYTSPFKKYDAKTFGSLSRREKEDVICSYWSKFSQQSSRSKRQEKFPVVLQLMGQSRIDVNAAEAFIDLFPVSEQRKDSFVKIKLHSTGVKQDAGGKTRPYFVYSCWWRVDGVEHELLAEDYSVSSAKNTVATNALKEVLGEKELDLLIYMTQPFFWKGVNVAQIRESIRGQNNRRIGARPSNTVHTAVSAEISSPTNTSVHQSATEFSSFSGLNSNFTKGTSKIQRQTVLKDVAALERYLATRNEPKPQYTIAEAFHVKCSVRNRIFESVWHDEVGAKCLAAMQGIEYLWGSKFCEEIEEIDLTD